MELYKEKLKLNNILLGIGSLVMAIFSLLAIGGELGWFPFVRPVAGDSHWQSAWYGYITGASIGLCAVMIFFLIRNCRAMTDEKKLKSLYVKCNDERTIQIQTLARNTAMQILLWMGLIATVIAGYFNVAVSLTILACTAISSFVSIVLTVYYNEKL